MKPFDRGSLTKQAYQRFQESDRWADFRETVFIRDNYTCRICGCTQNLEPHHIRYTDDEGYTEWAEPDNAVTLCRPCHQIVTKAVERAKTAEIHVTGKLSYMNWQHSFNVAAYGVYKEIVSATVFELWKRSLQEDAGNVPFRQLDTMNAIGGIVVETLRNQVANFGQDRDIAFVSAVQQKITLYLAEGYNEYKSQGFSDTDIKRFFKLDDQKLYKVKENAARLIRGTLCRGFHDGTGGSG